MRRDLARRNYLPLAIEFAVNVLKLGVEGNLEFAKYWREVLDILDNMSRALWETEPDF